MPASHRLEALRMDEFGALDSPVHRLDARAKAIVTIAFIIVVMSFPRYELSGLTPFFLYPVALLALSGVPPAFILRKILIAAPFAICIGLFNPLLDRQPFLLPGGHVLAGGWISFASILVRFVLTVGAALTLVASTGMHRLCAGLERVGVPRAFVVQLLFLHRYLFVVADDGLRMRRALELRSAGARSPSLRVYGSVTGHLLLRSLDRAHRVYAAMRSRGFDGRVRALAEAGSRGADIGFVAGWVAFFVVARTWNLAATFGSLITGGAP